MVLNSRIDHGRSLAPGASAAWDGWGLPASPSEREKAKADATRLIIRDASGRVIQTYVWPVQSAGSAPDATAKVGSGAKPAVTETPEAFTAKDGDLSIQIDKTTGLLVSTSRQGHTYSLKNGPGVVAMGPRPVPVRGQTTPPPQPSTAEPSKLVSLTHAMEGDHLVISAAFDGPMKTLRYRLKPNGWLRIYEVRTCCMGDDPKRGVLNRWSQSHDRKNLFVVDGAGFTSAGWQNPTMTILSLSMRASEFLASERNKRNL